MSAPRRHEFLIGIAAVALAAAVPVAHAQEASPTPAPSRTPSVIYLPGVVPERYSIGPAATPAPAPTPAASPAVRATPAPAAAPAPRATATPAPRTASPAQAPPTPRATPTPAGEGAPATAPPVSETPAQPAPEMAPLPLPQAQPAEAPAAPDGVPPWLWALLGAGGSALLIGGAWAVQRRRAKERATAEAKTARAAAPPAAVPVPPAVPEARTPPPRRPAPAAPPARPATPDPFELALRPTRIEVNERELVLEFELLISNLQDAPAENIRVQPAMISANPEQDRQITAFHASPLLDSAAPGFDLPAGGGGRMPVRLALPREQIHVVQVAGRPMCVPMVMLTLRWRAGITLRRFAADFMVGTAGQGPKLGPIWLDKPELAGALSAIRYQPREIAAA